jgi:surface antigen
MITDEMLVAFADGEADDATIEAVTRALEQDEALADRLDLFVTTRHILKSQLDPVGREPVPDALTRFVMSGGQVAAPANQPVSRIAPAPGPARRGWGALPMAAAVAGVMAGGLGYWAGTISAPSPSAGAVASLAAAEVELARALDGAADGDRRDWRGAGRSGGIELRQSYNTANGFCRSYGVSEPAAASGWAGIACRQDGAWRTQIVAAEPRGDGAIRPASGSGGAIEAFLDAAQAGDALDAAAVKEQIGKGWR